MEASRNQHLRVTVLVAAAEVKTEILTCAEVTYFNELVGKTLLTEVKILVDELAVGCTAVSIVVSS